MKKRYVLYVSFLLVVILFLPHGLAQGSSQWELPQGAKARYGKGWINDITFSPDGTQLAVATTIGIWIYDVLTGRAVKLLTGEMKGANAISYSPNTRDLLAGAHSDRTVRLWNVSTGNQKLLPALSEHTKAIYTIDFSADGRMLASGSEDNTIRVCDVHTEELLSILPESNAAVYTVAFAPNSGTQVVSVSSILAGGSGDGTIRVWDAGSGSLMYELNEHNKSVVEVDFSPDGNNLVSVSLDRTIQFWDLVAIDRRQSTPTQYSTAVYTVDFSPDGHTIATGSADELIRVWRTNPRERELVHTFTGHTDSVWAVELSPDSNLLASGSLDGTVRLWNTRFSTSLVTITGHTGGVKALAYVEDNRIHACGTGLDDKLRLWDAGTGRQLSIIREHRGLTESVAFSKDRRILASGGNKNGTIFLSEVSEIRNRNQGFGGNNPPIALTGNGNGITALALSPEGSTLASGGRDGKIHLIDVATRQNLTILRGAERTVTALAFAPDGTILLSGEENGTVRAWDAHSGEALDIGNTFNSRTSIPVTALAFSSTTRFLAIGNATGKILLLNIDRNSTTSISTKHSRKITALTFSEDDTTLVSGSGDGTILLWNMDTDPVLPQVLNSTVSFGIPNIEGERFRIFGTGFVIGPNQIATNYHVIKGTRRPFVKVRLVGTQTLFNIKEITKVDEENDLAILKITGIDAPALHLGNSDAVQIGETIYVAGNPMGIEGTLSDGIVSNIILHNRKKQILITAPISPGSSGGPVLNNRGEVIGIATASHSNTEAENINFAVPSNYLKALLREVQ